jgi:hypothetical protein
MEKTQLLHEKLFWLNIDANRKKKYYTKYEAKYLYALAGLTVFEMLLQKNIDWQDKDNLIGKIDNPPTDNLLFEIWDLCVTPNKISWFWLVGRKQPIAKTANDWLKAIVGKVNKFTNQIEQSLVKKNIIFLEEKKMLGLLPTKNIHVKEPEQQALYRKYLEAIVLHQQPPTITDFILLKVIKACKLHNLITLQTDIDKLEDFYEKLAVWASQKIEDEAIIKLLEETDFERDLEDLVESLDFLTDMIDSIADSVGDAGGGDGGDSGGGDGGSD